MNPDSRTVRVNAEGVTWLRGRDPRHVPRLEPSQPLGAVTAEPDAGVRVTAIDIL